MDTQEGRTQPGAWWTQHRPWLVDLALVAVTLCASMGFSPVNGRRTDATTRVGTVLTAATALALWWRRRAALALAVTGCVQRAAPVGRPEEPRAAGDEERRGGTPPRTTALSKSCPAIDVGETVIPRSQNHSALHRRRARLSLAGGVAGLAMVVSTLPACTGLVDAPARATSQPPAGATPDVPDPADQELTWRPCFTGEVLEFLPPGSERQECADYVVPRDWESPGDGQLLSIAVSRLPATGKAEGVLLTNPGGPGSPGVTTPLDYLDAGRARLTESRDIIGVDVRGAGASTTVTCSSATTTEDSLDPRDRSEAATNLLLDTAEVIARACQDDPQNLSPVITTKQTVRDLDLLRELLGEEKVDMVGSSSGTWLGAAYAQTFPERVGRFVLDANNDFTSTWQESFALQPLGFQRRFESDFLPWAAKHDERFGIGATPEEVDATYERVRAALAADSPGGGKGVDDTVVQAMYSKASFSGLADYLADLDDQAAALEQRADAPAPQVEPGTTAIAGGAQQRLAPTQGLATTPAPDFARSTFLNIICNDTAWTGDRDSQLASSAEQGEKYPLFGWSTLSRPCVPWDRPESATLAPRTGKGVPPVLMVQSENDPATPIEGARIARENFAGARLLEVLDEGDHTVYPSDNECVNDKVEDFLLGVTEAEDSTCQGVGLPEPEPALEPGAEPPAAVEPGAPSQGTPLQRAQRWSAIAGLGTAAQD